MMTTLILAAVVGVTHTILGPDHWLPFVGLARSERWSMRRLFFVVAAFGALHVASAVLLAVLADAAGGAFRWIVAHDRERAIGVGSLWLIFAIALWRRARIERPALAGAKGLGLYLPLAAIVGPCEWIWPTLSAAKATAAGAASFIAPCAVFAAATIATMLVTTGVLAFGAERMLRGRFAAVTVRRFAAVLAGVSGIAMIAGF